MILSFAMFLILLMFNILVIIYDHKIKLNNKVKSMILIIIIIAFFLFMYAKILLVNDNLLNIDVDSIILNMNESFDSVISVYFNTLLYLIGLIIHLVIMFQLFSLFVLLVIKLFLDENSKYIFTKKRVNFKVSKSVISSFKSVYIILGALLLYFILAFDVVVNFQVPSSDQLDPEQKLAYISVFRNIIVVISIIYIYFYVNPLLKFIKKNIKKFLVKYDV